MNSEYTKRKWSKARRATSNVRVTCYVSKKNTELGNGEWGTVYASRRYLVAGIGRREKREGKEGIEKREEKANGGNNNNKRATGNSLCTCPDVC